MKIWGILMHLGRNMWADKNAQTELNFDENVWRRFVDKCSECGINMIVMDVGEGVQWESHPELAIKGSWSKEKLSGEVKRLGDLGIELVPKLNFSTLHDAWLQEYGRMVSSQIYYKVCKELIEEVYEIFLHPSYIHIGMDEEDQRHVTSFRDDFHMTVMRHDPLLVHDINYLVKCVEDTGAKCQMWHDQMVERRPEYVEQITKSVIPDVWMYYSHFKENWNRVDEEPQYVQDYYKGSFKRFFGYEIEYVEEDPFVQKTIALTKKFIKEKRPFIAVPSNYQIKGCEVDTAKFIMQEDPDFEACIGMIDAPWGAMVPEKEAHYFEALEFMAEAKKIAGLI